jgi:hypothetical protein
MPLLRWFWDRLLLIFAWRMAPPINANGLISGRPLVGLGSLAVQTSIGPPAAATRTNGRGLRSALWVAANQAIRQRRVGEGRGKNGQCSAMAGRMKSCPTRGDGGDAPRAGHAVSTRWWGYGQFRHAPLRQPGKKLDWERRIGVVSATVWLCICTANHKSLK